MLEEPLLTVNLCFLLLVLLAVKQPVLVSKTEGKSVKYFTNVVHAPSDVVCARKIKGIEGFQSEIANFSCKMLSLD